MNHTVVFPNIPARAVPATKPLLTFSFRRVAAQSFGALAFVFLLAVYNSSSQPDSAAQLTADNQLSPAVRTFE